MKNVLPLLARIFLSALFLMSGFNKMTDPVGTQQYMASHGMPLTAVFLSGAIALELAGGISVLLGYKARWGALALIIFLIPATLIFHTNFSERIQVIQFTKNLAIFGGLLLIVSDGPGPYSLDKRKPRLFIK